MFNGVTDGSVMLIGMLIAVGVTNQEFFKQTTVLYWQNQNYTFTVGELFAYFVIGSQLLAVLVKYLFPNLTLYSLICILRNEYKLKNSE